MLILFQGDSITDCGRGRTDDPNHLLGHGYVFLIAARLGRDRGSAAPRFVNRGISGNRVSDLYGRWNEDAIALAPDRLSVLIGVNDAWRAMKEQASGVTDRFERAYRLLLEETAEALPRTGLVLCEPFILNTGSPALKWSAWKKRLDAYQRLVRELAREHGALFVPLQDRFDAACAEAGPEHWLWDGVHPTAAGHQLIADGWLAAVRESPDSGVQ
jgi:lysophospholipase L1-like esterase